MEGAEPQQALVLALSARGRVGHGVVRLPPAQPGAVRPARACGKVHRPRGRRQDAELLGADLKGARLWFANLQDADLESAHVENLWVDVRILNIFSDLILPDDVFGGANLDRADLRGANLRGVRGLAQEQLGAANGDDRTVLPEGLTRPAHWSRSEGNEGQPGDGTTGQ